LPVHLRQLRQRLLQFLPGRHPLAHGPGQGQRHVVTGGGALLQLRRAARRALRGN
jgi:hypothetical protein